jgi:arginyl-tRNA synthetase
MRSEHILKTAIAEALKICFSIEIPAEAIELQATDKNFKGSHTLVVFPFVKHARRRPDEVAQIIGDFLLKNYSEIVTEVEAVKGFLNISLSDKFWSEVFSQININADENLPANGEKVMVEYSSPNTNKPLHLGHLRNNFLGYSVSELLKAAGYEVIKANLVNDRGIHICKSMVAYQKFGNGSTPESAGMKGDHFVGDFYVKFDKAYKEEVVALKAAGKSEEEAEKSAPLMLEAQEMLRKWEAGDEEVLALWKKMNGWVLSGFDDTYKKIGVDFDKFYFESDTYLLGNDIVAEGLEKGIFYKRPDGAVAIDLKPDGLDEKVLLRSDGTSVYMTQDMGTADLKYKDFSMSKSVYVVGNEQDYHFKVLQIIMQKLGRPYADGIYHLSYGMVELPHGKMKSREGTVVDADDLVSEMVNIARERTLELGKIENFDSEEAEKLYLQLALGALKYYILRVDPKKKMLFNPEESIDFQGNSGVYIQFTHARICALVRKANELNLDYAEISNDIALQPAERDLIALLEKTDERIRHAAEKYAPDEAANFMYEIARAYSRFYTELSVLNESNLEIKKFRLKLTQQAGFALKKIGKLLGIQMPERM